ncbi:stage V sporulation protein AE [Terribacillus halophilus]|uniref:Stage V sporulation protein AE n=1 Tax=Terribacillus halophilus TaxID=361279 RepID=A0A1G6UZ19_9BACI|nr:stage V sporulation protein AE [Terribacillus halophilus]SDD45907.1 stage V sporulation protein AE [Terribacillus halophilus]
MKKVILITDGDAYAKRSIDYLAEILGGTSLSYLADNPMTIDAQSMKNAIHTADDEPVYVLLDDGGVPGIGNGEKLLLAIADDPEIDVIGALAVAAHTQNREWSRVSFSIDQDGELQPFGVDKEGVITEEFGRINGDTVYLLDQLDIPLVIAIGDIGKMHGKDAIELGSPITEQALRIILEREGSRNG